METLETRFEELERSGAISLEEANTASASQQSSKSKVQLLPDGARFPDEIQAEIERYGLDPSVDGPI